MLHLLYYRYKKSGKISTKKGGGLIIRHGRIIRILRYMCACAQNAERESGTKPRIGHRTITHYVIQCSLTERGSRPDSFS